ncbi:hypothetical protein FBF90_15280 [Serratia marcescens]|jgi:hypothetical protein|nr:hypothetical protein BVG95_11720 [Serratia marcescens]KAB1578555.1 hypothetical protein F7687_23225 [Serratia marcescens]KFF79452.1 hypothetical protein IY40_08865 [Serratia marcescens]QDI14452.1 hypothetical protein FBF84_15290 [Serratia marcescens]QDI24194.1 hypothetical protein FBF90_15280 [Serratia marcescens]
MRGTICSVNFLMALRSISVGIVFFIMVFPMWLIGIIAAQPKVMSGVLNNDVACIKASRRLFIATILFFLLLAATIRTMPAAHRLGKSFLPY